MFKLTKIHDHLFISNYWNTQDIQPVLKENGIVAIVNLMHDENYTPPKGIMYLWKGIADHKYIPLETIEEILTFIANNMKKGAVLVHCASGKSRSGGIIVARLLVENPNWNWEVAINFVRKKRFIIPAMSIRDSILDYFEQKEGNRRE
ncbi:MAG: dual specificity protein phosphatase family protein [Promethearchaeota archaeon]